MTGGQWLKGKVQSLKGDGLTSLAVVDLGFKVIQANITKLRKDPDELHDFILPPDPDMVSAVPSATGQDQVEAAPAAESSRTAQTVTAGTPVDPELGNAQQGGSSSSTAGGPPLEPPVSGGRDEKCKTRNVSAHLFQQVIHILHAIINMRHMKVSCLNQFSEVNLTCLNCLLGVKGCPLPVRRPDYQQDFP